jgi:hypothetical protein
VSSYREVLQDVLEWAKGEAGWHVWPAPDSLPAPVRRAFDLLHHEAPAETQEAARKIADNLWRDAEHWRELTDPGQFIASSVTDPQVERREALRRTARAAVEDWLGVHPGGTRE